MRHLIKANLSTALFAVKIAALLLFDFITSFEYDYFGLYSVAIGLTSAFFVFSGLGGRTFVLSSGLTHDEFKAFNKLAVVLGVFSLAVVFLLNYQGPLIYLVAAVSLVKVLDNQFDNYISYAQVHVGREFAFNILNVKSIVVAAVYLAAVPLFGLQATLLIELLVVALFLLWLATDARRRVDDNDGVMRVVSPAFVWDVFQYNICATLNAALTTLFLYVLAYREGVDGEATLFIAKVVAVQSMISRVMLMNNIYFETELTQHRKKVTRTSLLVLIAVVAGVVGVGFWLTPSDVESLYIMAGLFTAINVFNMVMRQHLVLLNKISILTKLHLLEIVTFTLLIAVFEQGAVELMILFTLYRMFRVALFSRLIAQEG